MSSFSASVVHCIEMSAHQQHTQKYTDCFQRILVKFVLENSAFTEETCIYSD